MTNRIRNMCSECANWYEYEPGYESDEHCQRCLHKELKAIEEEAENDVRKLNKLMEELEEACISESKLRAERDEALSTIKRLESRIQTIVEREIASKKIEVEKQEAPSDTEKLAAIVGKILIEEMFQLDKKGIKRALKRLEGMLL